MHTLPWVAEVTVFSVVLSVLVCARVCVAVCLCVCVSVPASGSCRERAWGGGHDDTRAGFRQASGVNIAESVTCVGCVIRVLRIAACLCSASGDECDVFGVLLGVGCVSGGYRQ